LQRASFILCGLQKLGIFLRFLLKGLCTWSKRLNTS